MFTTGKIIFAIIFIIAFVVAMIVMYRKDLAQHKIYYKGSTYIFVAFIGFIGILFLIKTFLKR